MEFILLYWKIETMLYCCNAVAEESKMTFPLAGIESGSADKLRHYSRDDTKIGFRGLGL